jgi:hypothetical protein
MSAFTYKFKEGSVHKVSAETAGNVCQMLSETKQGLTPKSLVDYSRSEDAPTHNEFEWNDGVAGERYREWQARKLIAHLIIVKSDTANEREIKLVQQYSDRGFVSVRGDKEAEEPEEQKENRQYVGLFSALDHEIWRQSLLKDARKDMTIFKAKYQRLEELATIIKDIDDYLRA